MVCFRLLPLKTMVVSMTIILMAFCLSSCKESDAIETKSLKPIKVTIQKVTLVSDHVTILVSSFLEAEKTSPISFEVPGKIVKLAVDLGDHVKKNQVVAQVEMDDYKNYLEIAQANYIKAKDVFNRSTPLFKEGVIPEKTLIEVTAGLAQARAQRNIIQKQVRDTKLKAPFAGVIGMKAIEIGQMVSPGIPAFTIVKNDKIYACSAVPESEIEQLKIGHKAVVTVPALGNQTFYGLVKHIGPVADPRTRTYMVKIILENSDYRLRPGMISTVSIETDKQIETLTIPGRAIVRDTNNLTYVFLADKNESRAFRKRVFTGAVHGSEIRIKRGLIPGDILVLSGQHKLTDGCQITTIEN
ncbi:MAG: efflux RND transporter periplasmic adaptor subunit [Desulfobacteraceae bacterium]|nr:efflux RND transporter periplasmic adaptor subunit [Desulfobacteraceae bacterium]